MRLCVSVLFFPFQKGVVLFRFIRPVSKTPLRYGLHLVFRCFRGIRLEPYTHPVHITCLCYWDTAGDKHTVTLNTHNSLHSPY